MVLMVARIDTIVREACDGTFVFIYVTEPLMDDEPACLDWILPPTSFFCEVFV